MTVIMPIAAELLTAPVLNQGWQDRQLPARDLSQRKPETNATEAPRKKQEKEDPKESTASSDTFADLLRQMLGVQTQTQNETKSASGQVQKSDDKTEQVDLNPVSSLAGSAAQTTTRQMETAGQETLPKSGPTVPQQSKVAAQPEPSTSTNRQEVANAGQQKIDSKSTSLPATSMQSVTDSRREETPTAVSTSTQPVRSAASVSRPVVMTNEPDVPPEQMPIPLQFARQPMQSLEKPELLQVSSDPDNVTREIFAALERTEMEGTSGTGRVTSVSTVATTPVAVSPSRGSAMDLLNPNTNILPAPETVVPDPNSIAGLAGSQQTGLQYSGTGRDSSPSLENEQVSLIRPASLTTTGTVGSPAGGPVSGPAVAGSELSTTLSAELRQPLSTQVAKAVTEHLQESPAKDPDTLTIQLDPPELGEMVIELSKTEEGLAVRVSAREAVTMEMLFSRGTEIEHHLKASEIELSSLEFLSPGMMNQQQQSFRQRSRSSDEMEAADAVRRTSGRRSATRGAASAATGNTASVAGDSARALSFRA